MPALDRNVKVTCGDCGTSVTKKHLSRHKSGCSGGTLYCPKSLNFSTKSRDDLNYHIAKKHSVRRPSITYKCKLCHAEFIGFYALRQYKNTQHGTKFGFGANNIDVEDIVGAVDDQSLREELESCKHFLSDTEMENGRHRVFNFAMSSLNMSLLNDKLDYVIKELKCAAKVNLAFVFVLKNIEDGLCRYLYAQANNTIMERAKLVCTQADMTNLKETMQKLDIVHLCSRERSNTKLKFYKLTNLTIVALLLKGVPMGCKDTVLPEPLLKNHNVNCLTFQRNTRQPYNEKLCLFRALALHLHGNEKLEEETSKIFKLFLNNSGEGDLSMFQGVHMSDIPKVEEMLHLNIFLYDIDFFDGELIAELCRRSIQKYEKSVKLLRYNNHICYVKNMNSLFKAFRCTSIDTFFSKTGNLEQHLVTCSDRVKHIYPKNVYELRETLLKSWMHSTSHTEMSKNCSRIWQYLTLSPFVSRKSHTSKLRLQGGLESMFYISFNIVKLDSGNHFSLQRQSSSSHLVFHHCSRKISNSKQSSDEIEFHRSRDCNQDKTVCYTGTTQPKTQPSREGVKICRRLYRGGRGRGFIYTIPAYAKESIN